MIESPLLLDFKIIDETDDYAVVDKPPFLLIHPTKPDGTRTLWQELRGLFAFEIAAGGQASIVNRLDRETSGLVLIAKKTDKFSLIRAIPHTGRTHQIRVHLSSIGHPIVGDKIYGPDEQLYLHFIETGWTPELECELFLPRHALHSARLTIEGDREWNSPLPQDLAQFTT